MWDSNNSTNICDSKKHIKYTIKKKFYKEEINIQYSKSDNMLYIFIYGIFICGKRYKWQ